MHSLLILIVFILLFGRTNCFSRGGARIFHLLKQDVRMRTRTQLAVASSQGAEEKRTLWVLPNSPVPKEEVWRYLNDWAAATADEGTAVNVESRGNEGVTFTFRASADSYLALDVVSNGQEDGGLGNSVEIVSRLVVHRSEGEDPGITNLIGMVSQNLIDSLCHDIGDILMSKPDGNSAVVDKDTNQMVASFGAEEDANTELENVGISDSQFERQLEHMDTMSSSLEVSKADLEGSLNAALLDDGESHAGYSGAITQKWSNLAAGQEVVVANYIRSWADQKFAGRGAGIEATDIPFGVKLTFAVSELLRLRLRVHCEFYDSNRIKDLYALAELVVVDDDYHDEDDETASISLPARIVQESNLVSMATRNIAASLRRDLSSLLLEPADSLSESGGVVQEGREEVVVTGERPLLGDLSVGDDAARSLAQAEQQRLQKNGKRSKADDDLRSRLKQQQSQRASNIVTGSSSTSPIDVETGSGAITTTSQSAGSYGSNSGDGGVLEGSNDAEEHVRASILSRGKTEPSPEKASSQQQQKKHDPHVQERAWQEGVKLESYEGRGMEEQALQELQEMMRSSEKEGFLAVLKQHKEAKGKIGNESGGKGATVTTGATGAVDVNTQQDLEDLLHEGARHSSRVRDRLADQEQEREQEQEGDSMVDQAAALLARDNRASQQEDLNEPGTAFPMDLERAGFATVNPRLDVADRNGPNGPGPEGTDLIDIFQGPPRPEGVGVGDAIPAPASSIEGQMAAKQASLTPPNPSTIDSDDRTLQLLVNELQHQPQERHGEVLASYKDLLLSDNLLFLLQRDNEVVREEGRRAAYKKITDMAQEAILEVGALVKSESVRHLDTIMKVCEVAALHQHDEEEFLDRMAPLRAYFDTALLGYLDYALQEEEAGIRANGGDPVKLPSRWLSVLRLVQQGVLAEFESRFDRVLEPLLLTVRFEEEHVRAAVFSRFVDITAAVDLPYMRQLGVNMVEGIVQKAAMGEAVDPALLVTLESFQNDCLERYLSEEIVEEKLAEFRAEVETQGKELVVRKRHPLVQAQIDDENEERRKRGMAPLTATQMLPDAADRADVDMVGESIINSGKGRGEGGGQEG